MKKPAIHLPSLSPRSKLAFSVLLFFSTMMANAAPGSTAKPTKQFKIFDATHYQDKPNLSPYGFLPIDLVYENRLTDKANFYSKNRVFSAAKISAVASAAQRQPNVLVSLDMESWGWSPSAIQKYVMSIREFKRTNPKSKVGLYGVMPYGQWKLYQAFSKYAPKSMEAWKRYQDQAQPIAQEVDVFMPSLYTFGPNIEAWKKMAKTAIAKARSIDPNKPVYAYIWPQFYTTHRNALNDPYQGEFLPPSMWRDELETLYPIADGVIIWSSDSSTTHDNRTRKAKFSSNMPWFQETIDFMKSHRIHSMPIGN